MRRLITTLLLISVVLAVDPIWAEEVAGVEPAAKPGLLHRIVMYLPNRCLDLADILRLRVRVGPGAAVHVRATRYLNAYAGEYASWCVGLPGPRRSPPVRWPADREDLKGLMLMGVDATDDTPYHPGYSASEFDVGIHALLIGAEVGIDPVEIGDFLLGWLGMDLCKDDR